MSQQVGILDLTFTAGEDLRNYQYYAVYLSADNTVSVCTTAHVDPIGILQNDPNTGEEAVVRVLGSTKVKVGGAVTYGVRCIVATDGMIEAVGALHQTEQIICGIMLADAGADGDIAEMLLTHESFVKGTDT